MVHLREALSSLTRRWKKQRYNRRPHLRIAHLKQDVEKYAHNLHNARWQPVCDCLHNGTSLKRTWNLFRHLVDPTTTKAETTSRLVTLAHNLSNFFPNPLDTLRDIYIGQTPPLFAPHPQYHAPPNSKLDAPFTKADDYGRPPPPKS
ncbi:hypothetical protein HPB48_022709 [Haemaphysalis longicornis]|uniref:Uncharacterized protein n=1 Tax=Haemaphysalis longicornis TaxID=44386 RepID=A0A9J6FYY3_HAELO|nr:hypothetical protein HPB48_022709 [Haemaphysalis longicornis]